MEVTRVVNEWTDGEGIRQRQISKNIENKPIDFGSLNKPKNKDITKVEFFIPSRSQGQGFINFGNLFD